MLSKCNSVYLIAGRIYLTCRKKGQSRKNYESVLAVRHIVDSGLLADMLSKKNKESKNFADGVVGKYVKKDTPPSVPCK